MNAEMSDSRGGQTCSMYQRHGGCRKTISDQEPQHKNLKTQIYLQSTLLLHHNSFWNDLQK